MDLADFLADRSGVATRSGLVALLGRHAFDNLVKRGQLLAVFPRVYAYPWDVDQLDIRRRAALLTVGGEAALTHHSALDLRELPVPDDAPLHVTAYQPRHPRGVPDELVVHRTLLPLDPVEVNGLPVGRVDSALVTSWPLTSGSIQRAPAIEAWRRRLVSLPRLAAAAEAMWWVPEIGELRKLVGKLVAGCESELELWGYSDVFDVPGLRDANRQRVVRVGGKTYRMDMTYDEEMLNVELDGREFHASVERWERDIARDLAVAKLGWQTIRLSHSRLTRDVDGCRRDVLAVREVRRRLAG